MSAIIATCVDISLDYYNKNSTLIQQKSNKFKLGQNGPFWGSL